MTDYISWIGSYKLKLDEKIDAENEYNNIIMHLTSLKFSQPIQKQWIIEISVNKINRIKSFGLEKEEIILKNIILNTLENYVIFYKDVIQNESFLIYKLDPITNKNKKKYECINFNPDLFQFLEKSNSIEKAVKSYTIKGEIFNLGDHFIKIGTYKKGLEKIIFQIQYKGCNFQKDFLKNPGNLFFDYEEDCLLSDFYEYSFKNKMREKIKFPKISSNIFIDFGLEDLNTSYKAGNILELLDEIFS